MFNSQIETTEEINNLVEPIKGPITPNKLLRLRDLMYSKIIVRPYNETVKEAEKLIRWKRTAVEILVDAYVYDGKACTDLVVLFIALCRALDLETNFVKVKKENMVHSIAEVKLGNNWYIFDVSNKKSTPAKGSITNKNPYQGWQLWKKGRDAWDLGLSDFEDIEKINMK